MCAKMMATLKEAKMPAVPHVDPGAPGRGDSSMIHRLRAYATWLNLALAVIFGLIPALSIAGEPSAKAPTFAKDVAPILQEKCQTCHREGSMAPMSLVTYEQVRPWAKAIEERVVTRQMPPWHLDKTVGIQEFQNDISLSDEQIQTIARWVDAGAPLGDSKDMPPAKEWPKDGGWQLAKQFGPPDLVIESEPYTMPARGQDVWFKPLTAIPIDEPRWVRAVEIRPGTPAGRKITHHALAYLQQEEPGSNSGIQTQGLLMEWAVNKNYDIYRPNTGKLLLPGARVGGKCTITPWARRFAITWN
jgi:hypothetical protein